MDKKMNETYQGILDLLRQSERVARIYRKEHNQEMAQLVIRMASVIVDMQLTLSGIRKYERDFWNDKKAMIRKDQD